MTNIEVIEVESKRDLNQFIDYPNKLYKGDPNYVAPLMVERKEFFDSQKNPFFKFARVKLFLARKNGQICGRIATCVNYQHNEYHNELMGGFGFFDCPDDYEIVSTLLKVAMITLKKEGMEIMRGPLNFSTNHECGFLVEGFDSPPVVMMTYNQPYLPALTERFGLKKSMDLLAFSLTVHEEVSPRILKVVDKLQERSNLKVRTLNMSNFDREIALIRDVYNQAWKYNWGFVPMDENEFNYTAKNLKQVVDPNMVFIIESDGKPIAFALALPDINQALIHLRGRLFPFGLFKLLWHTKIKSKINRVRLVTFGVIPEFQKRGIDSLLFINCFREGEKHGYPNGELSWILESNELMIRGAEHMKAKLYKRYRIYELPL